MFSVTPALFITSNLLPFVSLGSQFECSEGAIEGCVLVEIFSMGKNDHTNSFPIYVYVKSYELNFYLARLLIVIIGLCLERLVIALDVPVRENKQNLWQCSDSSFSQMHFWKHPLIVDISGSDINAID